MNHTQIINKYIKENNYTCYLEIGVWNGENFRNVNIEEKYSVDPDPKTKPTHRMTSDQFFKTNIKKFDIIFVDGLHHANQVYRDILNGLEVLKPNGVILCHDMNPTTEEMQIVPRQTNVWTGDCWKSFVRLRSENKGDLEMFVIDTDFGIGVIRKTKTVNEEKRLDLNGQTLNYQNLENNRKEWLNLITLGEFTDEN